MCVPYCPMNAIGADGKVKAVKIDLDECTDCGVCFRAKVCPVDALVDEAYAWPRSVRAAFSNPLVEHKETRVPGRGTEEVKTNDVTGQFRKGYVGVTAEMGRPGVGVRFRDVQKVAQALARAKVVFAPNNPVTRLMTDTATGQLNSDDPQGKSVLCHDRDHVPDQQPPAGDQGDPKSCPANRFRLQPDDFNQTG